MVKLIVFSFIFFTVIIHTRITLVFKGKNIKDMLKIYKKKVTIKNGLKFIK